MTKVTKSVAPNAAELKIKLDALQGMFQLSRSRFCSRGDRLAEMCPFSR